MNQAPGQTGRLGWYTRRLGSMTPAEIVWRGRRLAGQRLPRREFSERSTRALLRAGVDWGTLTEGFREAAGRPLLLDRSRARALAASHPDQVAALVAAAHRVRAGRVSYFGYPEVQLAEPIDWNHDPLSDFHWPARDANRIDHRVAVADPKWIWELNRLQHLPWLAQAWLFTDDDGFAELALDHLDSWMDQNPVGSGIAWRGAFEAGVRAVSVAIALQGLRDADALTPARLQRSVRMLAASADRCWRDRSRFSSANNHLVGELAGLATVAMLFPELANAGRWEDRALRTLTLEASRQILPDGAGAEQAVGYQVFTAELVLVVAALLTSRGDQPPAGLTAAVDHSASYLAAVVGEHDPDPTYGDDDEGFALRLGAERRRTVRDHLAIVGALTGNPSARSAGSATLSALWIEALSGGRVDGNHESDKADLGRSLVAPDGGLVVLRSERRRITVDVGPLGYLSIAAHGHADALSVTVSLDGQEVIGDPGAASYYGHPEWRQVHRGTRVHGTVTVDGADQSVSGGPFLWSEHARVQVHVADPERGVVDAEHDGYQRLADPVTHRRWVLAPPNVGDALLIVDEVAGAGEHEMRVSWPLHPGLEIDEIGDGYVLTRMDEVVARVAMASASTPALILEAVRGDTTHHLGWYSDRLESRVPSWLIGGVVHGVVPLVQATVMMTAGDEGPALSDLEVSHHADVITTSWASGRRQYSVAIDTSRAGAIEFHFEFSS